MDIITEVNKAQEAIYASGGTVKQFCKGAGITPRTWRDWRNGSLPQMRKWQRVQAAIKALKSAQ